MGYEYEELHPLVGLSCPFVFLNQPAEDVNVTDAAGHKVVGGHWEPEGAEDEVREGQGEDEGRGRVLLQLLGGPQGQQGPAVQEHAHNADHDGRGEAHQHRPLRQGGGVHLEGDRERVTMERSAIKECHCHWDVH